MKATSFRITWDNHLREEQRWSWQPAELVSMGKTISWEYTLEDGSVHKGFKHYMSVPEPFNPFDKQDKPEPEPTEDWDDEDD